MTDEQVAQYLKDINESEQAYKAWILKIIGEL